MLNSVGGDGDKTLHQEASGGGLTGVELFHRWFSRFVIYFMVTVICIGIVYILVWHLKYHVWDKFVNKKLLRRGSVSTSTYTGASQVSKSKSEPPAGLVNMNIPYEGSDYESDVDYIASLSSSFNDITSAECLQNCYDLLEHNLSVSLPASRRTSLVPPQKSNRKTSLIPDFLISHEFVPVNNMVASNELDENFGKSTTAHLHVSACYIYRSRTLFLELKALDTLNTRFDAHAQIYISVQVWRTDDSLHVPNKSYNESNFRKKVCEFEFKSKLYSIANCHFIGSKIELDSCCFECVLTSYFIYTVSFKLMVLDAYSRHNSLGEAHLVLKDLLPDKDFDKWLAVEMMKEDGVKELLVSLCFMPTSERIALTVIKARNLRNEKTRLGSTNAFVRIFLMVGGKKLKHKKTSTKMNDENPVFNETFNFRISESQLSALTFRLVVENDCLIDEYFGNKSDQIKIEGDEEPMKNFRFGTANIEADHFKGQASAHWIEMMKSPRRPIAQWHPLT